jgi:cytoskeleton protein RodZ
VNEAGAAPSSKSAAAAVEAAGAALLRERRRQGLSLGDISRQLKLSVRQVEALERDDYSGYKGPVFVHGFIRNYAKLLGLDPEPLIRATDLLLNPPVAAAEAQREEEHLQSLPARKAGPWLWSAAVALLVVAVAGSVYFGRHRLPDPERSVPAVAMRDRSAPAKAPAGTKSANEAKGRAGHKPAGASEAKRAGKTDAQASGAAASAAAEQRAPADSGIAMAAETAGRMTLRMVFEQESWVEIKDRNGNVVFGQLNPAGSRRSASGEPPLSIVIGNAAGVSLFLGDKSIDLAPHTRVDVARLTLE